MEQHSHATNVSPAPLRVASEAKRAKRIKYLKAALRSLEEQMDARLTDRSKTEVYALVAGIDAYKTLLKLVYNEDMC